MLERTAVLVSGSGGVEGRFTVGLPAQGRSIMGRWAAQIITQHITRCGFKPWLVLIRVHTVMTAGSVLTAPR